MASLRDLFITIGFDIDDKPLQQVEAGIRSLTVGITYLTAQAVASATSLFMLTKSTADEGAAALRSAQMLGINVETLQGLGHAAEKTGMTLEEVENGLQRMARSAYEASKSGSSLTNVYNKLRIHTRDSNGQVRSSEEILMDLSDRFQSMPDGLQKTALAMEIFGRSAETISTMSTRSRTSLISSSRIRPTSTRSRHAA